MQKPSHSPPGGEVAPEAVRMTGIYKAFSGTTVLDDVNFAVARGEVHALAGGNGAGKSTLMKILQGVYSMDAGRIEIDGQEVRIASIHEARAAGIGMVFQEFSLVPTLTVAQNIYLGAEPRGRLGLVDDRLAVKQARGVFETMEVEVDPRASVGSLGTAYWQLTEIAKALAQDARVLIMDEPTASLAKHETEALFALVERLKQRGISVIYISHRMDEIYRIADRITILRDGRHLLTERLSDVTPDQIIEGIVGRKVEGMEYRGRQPSDEAAPALEVTDLYAGPRTRGVTLSVRAGEILGLAGLMGSGRTELAQALFGITRIESGTVRLRGREVHISGPAKAVSEGIALVPEDRRAQGLVLEHSVRDNLLLPLLGQVSRGPFVQPGPSRSLSADLIKRYDVKAVHPNRPVRLLSGGNQQKVVIAKWLGTDPDVLILDEPTAGVDIGTKTEILETIRGLADAGKAVIVISSEYPELLAVSDRIAILRDGKVVDDLPRESIQDEETLQLAVQGVTA